VDHFVSGVVLEPGDEVDAGHRPAAEQGVNRCSGDQRPLWSRVESKRIRQFDIGDLHIDGR
jgi:hypothetical protein